MRLRFAAGAMDRKRRIEENEKLFREVNERVAELPRGFHGDAGREWVCECGDETCFERLTVPVDEYVEIRGHESWFVIKPGHEKLDVERIVRRSDGYFVVEKF